MAATEIEGRLGWRSTPGVMLEFSAPPVMVVA